MPLQVTCQTVVVWQAVRSTAVVKHVSTEASCGRGNFSVVCFRIPNCCYGIAWPVSAPFACRQRCRQHSSPVEALQQKAVSNERKALLVDQAPLNFQSQREPPGVEGSSLVGRPVASDEVIALCQVGELGRALELLSDMNEHTATPSLLMYKSLLNACRRKKALAQAKQVHAHLADHGLESTTFLGEYVVLTLVKFGSLEDAFHVFQRLPNRTVFSWNAMISGRVAARQNQEAVRVYYRMRKEGLHPDKHTFVAVLKACAALANVCEGKQVHGDILKYGYASDVFVGTCLIDMYAKCGTITDAQNVFDCLSTRNVVSWTAMLAAYVQQGQAEKALQQYEQMLEEGLSADDRTFVIVLKACGMLAENEQGVLVNQWAIKVKSVERGKEIHAKAWLKGYMSDAFVSSSLVSMYGKCGCIGCVHTVFNEVIQRNLVLWNTLLAASAQQGQAETVLKLYEQMQEEGLSPNDRTFVTVLQACGMLAGGAVLEGQSSRTKLLQKGKTIHAEAVRRAHATDIFLSSTLISMYGRMGSVTDGRKIFDGVAEPNVVAWNAMVAAHIHGCEAEKALLLYAQMREEGVSPDDCTFVSALQACGLLADTEDADVVDGGFVKVNSLQRGKSIHENACRKGYDSWLVVANTLISMYGKCGRAVDALTVFEGINQPGVVSWNVMLTVYAQQGQPDKTLQLFQRMQKQGGFPDDVTIVCVLQACSHMGSLEVCRQLHQNLVCTRSKLSPLLATTLINAYGRCASMVEAQAVFDSLSQPDVVSWNALMAGYAREGSYTAILRLYEDMRVVGMQPDSITFLSLLSACSHAGLVEKGLEYIEYMTRCGISPAIEHYVCLMDLLGRAGCFSRVEDVLSTMPVEPNLALWLCVMGACQKHGKLSIGKRAFDCAVRLHPQHPSAYLLMSNMYADAGLSTDATDMYSLMQKKCARKEPGRSWIEYEKVVNSFSVGDLNSEKQERLYVLLKYLR